MADKVPPTPKAQDDMPIVPPPSSLTIQHDYKAVLYLPNGKALVRRAGF